MYIRGPDEAGPGIFYNVPESNGYILAREYLGFDDQSEGDQEYGNIQQ
jgi:hypothetical protein